MTLWYRFTRYYCRSCGEECINDHRNTCTRYRECRKCHRVPDLDRELVDHLVPELRYAAHAVTCISTDSRRAGPVFGACPQTRKPARSPRPEGGDVNAVRATGGPDE
jgi:hypothetical protein